MAKHRTDSIEFKRQVSQENFGGETLHALSKRHDISRNLTRLWVEKFEAGALDEDAAAADLLHAYCRARLASGQTPEGVAEAAGVCPRTVSKMG